MAKRAVVYVGPVGEVLRRWERDGLGSPSRTVRDLVELFGPEYERRRALATKALAGKAGKEG